MSSQHASSGFAVRDHGCNGKEENNNNGDDDDDGEDDGDGEEVFVVGIAIIIINDENENKNDTNNVLLHCDWKRTRGSLRGETLGGILVGKWI